MKSDHVIDNLCKQMVNIAAIDGLSMDARVVLSIITTAIPELKEAIEEDVKTASEMCA